MRTIIVNKLLTLNIIMEIKDADSYIFDDIFWNVEEENWKTPHINKIKVFKDVKNEFSKK